MNKQASLELYASGRSAWNAWAKERSQELRRIVDAGLWQWETYQGDVNFTNPHARSWHIESVADFSYHEFPEAPDFSGFVFPGFATFVAAKFPLGARFAEARAMRGVCFNFARFGALADFAQAEFLSEGEFVNTQFMDEARFERCRFSPGEFEPQMNGHADFSDAEFAGLANFHGAKVASTVVLADTQFIGPALFDEAVFEGLVFLAGTKFSGEVSFNHAMLRSDTDFSSVSFAAPPKGLREDWTRKP
jgi:hypothetical protein